MFDLLPGQEAYVIINHERSGFSRQFITSARQRGGIRCSIVETTTKWREGEYRDCPNLLQGNNLAPILGTGPKVHQCVLAIQTHHNKEPHEIDCAQQNVQLLEICNGLGIPVLAAVLRQHDYLGDHGAEISLQAMIDKKLVTQVVYLDPHADSSTHSINSSIVEERNTDFADGLLRLIGTGFDHLPTISQVSLTTARINASR